MLYSLRCEVGDILVVFEYQPCDIFEGLSQPQEVETIDPTTFESYAGLGYIIFKLFSSNFMGTMRSVSWIFDTGAMYSYFSNQGYFVHI